MDWMKFFLLALVSLTLWGSCSGDMPNDKTSAHTATTNEKVINPIPEEQELQATEAPSAAVITTEPPVAEAEKEEEIEAQKKEVVKEETVKPKLVEAKKASTTTTKKAPKPKKKKRPSIKFDKVVHEFGMIKPGDVVNHKFYFTNTGKADLLIKKADVTCGCTTPSYPFIPIAPGERGFIGVTYDSTGKLGKQKPTVTLTTNAGTKKVYMEGYVISEMAKEQPGQ